MHSTYKPSSNSTTSAALIGPETATSASQLIGTTATRTKHSSSSNIEKLRLSTHLSNANQLSTGPRNNMRSSHQPQRPSTKQTRSSSSKYVENFSTWQGLSILHYYAL
eukprot:CCRYP_004053-RG/>CCRYP_004053-RG protein AED:0.45 eAED:0.62 QI:0/0/0/1/0/0/2/0/107